MRTQGNQIQGEDAPAMGLTLGNQALVLSSHGRHDQTTRLRRNGQLHDLQ